MTPINQAWLETIATVLDDGHEHATIKELICHTVYVPMDASIITLASRKLDYRAMCVETVDLLKDFTQVDHAAEVLAKNNLTQIILQRPVSVQWLIRDRMLYCVSAIGSSNVWLNLPREVHALSAMSSYLALALRKNHGIEIELGWLYETAGSRHLHQCDVERATMCLDPASSAVAFEYIPLNLQEFDGPGHLIEHYQSLVRGEGTTAYWLREAFR